MQPTSKDHRFIGAWALILGALLFNCGLSQQQDPEPPISEPPPPASGTPPPVSEPPPPADESPADSGPFEFYVAPSPDGSVYKENDVFLTAGETVTIGTCGISESITNGDTVLWIYDPNGALVVSNDNGAAADCGATSKVDFTATYTGYHQVRVGCLGTSPCYGTVGIGRRKGLVLFEAMNTDNATLNTYNKQFKFEEGDIVRISTCARNAQDASAEGNTYLRFYRQSAGLYSEIASNDDTPGCGAAAEILYTIPSTGYYQVRVGCSANTNCHGAVAIYVE